MNSETKRVFAIGGGVLLLLILGIYFATSAAVTRMSASAIAERDQEIEALKDERDKLQGRYHRVSDDLKVASKANEQASAQITNLIKEQREKEDLLKQTEAGLGRMERDLGSKQRAVEQLTNERTALGSSIADLEKAKTAIESAKKQLDDQVVSLRGQVTAEQGKVATLTKEKADLAAKLQATEKRFADLTAQTKSLEGKTAMMLAQAKEMQTSMNAAIAEAAKLRQENPELQTKAMTMDAAAKQMKEALDKAIADANAAKTAKAAAEKASADAMAKVASVEKNLAAMQAQLAQNSTQMTELQKSQAALKQEYDDMKVLATKTAEEKTAMAASLATVEQNLANAAKEKITLTQNIATTQKSLQDAKAENTKIITEKAALAKNVLDLQKALDVAKTTPKAAPGSMDPAAAKKLRDDLAKANAEAAKQKEEAAKLNGELVKLESALGKTRTEILQQAEAMKQQRAQLTQQLQAASKEATTHEQRVARLQGDLNTLKQELDGRRAYEQQVLSDLPLLAERPGELYGIAVPLFKALKRSAFHEITLEERNTMVGASELGHLVGTVSFRTNSSHVDDENQKQLADAIAAAPAGSHFVAVGYADRSGDEEYNEHLSSLRAIAVAESSDGAKKDSDSIQAVYFGQTEQFSQTELAKNRVVEVWRVSKE